jgi:hypothetical protein
MKRSLRSFWEGERLFIESEVHDGERLVVKETRSVEQGAEPVVAGAGKDDPIRGGHGEGEGSGSIRWFNNGQIGVWGSGLLAAPPGWRLVSWGLPRSYGGGFIEDAEIETAHPDGKALDLGDVVSTSGAIVLKLGHFTGTPGGAPFLLFERTP